MLVATKFKKERRFGSAEFGAVVLMGHPYNSTLAELPFVSSAIRMLGRMPFLASLSHPNLCCYVELVRSTVDDNAVILISEHYEMSLLTLIRQKKRISQSKILKITMEIASAIEYLHSSNVVVGYYTTDSIRLIDEECTARLSHYGLIFLSNGEIDLSCSIESIWYISPEKLISLNSIPNFASRSSDIWALGISLLEMNLGYIFRDLWNKKEYYHIFSGCIRKAVNGSLLKSLLDAIQEKLNSKIEINADMIKLIERMLILKPSRRPSAKELLNELKIISDNGARSELSSGDHSKYFSKFNIFANGVDLSTQIPTFDGQFDVLKNLSINQAYFLWKLSGSNVEKILINHGIIKANSPIMNLPLVITGECSTIGETSRICSSYFDTFVLPSKNLRQRIGAIDKNKLIICFELDYKKAEPNDLSLLVKEKDIEYQLRRMLIFDRLMAAFPFKKNRLILECKCDITPFHRPFVWAALLNVSFIDLQKFDRFNTFIEHPSDRQLLVDIPRCHQYDELMASPAAHNKLKRLLKAWLIAHKNYVYWQGLDSLTAPFLVLHFERLPYAYACLDSFISLYLCDFFLKDNSAVIQEYLTVFTHLLAYVDAPLYSHFKKMDFSPELFAIPWFLTCFAHVLPLHKLFHVWDVVLLADSSFPLFVGLAIIKQLRLQLIESQFNDAILLFSDLPDLNIENILQDSEELYNSVPPSCTYRTYASKHVRTQYHMKNLTTSELKEYSCPRIDAKDFLNAYVKESVLVIDVRTTKEFSRSSLPGSVNFVPLEGDCCLDPIKTALIRAQKAEHLIVIIDCQPGFTGKKVSNLCVLEGFNRVCLLDGYFDGIKSNPSFIRKSFTFSEGSQNF